MSFKIKKPCGCTLKRLEHNLPLQAVIITIIVIGFFMAMTDLNEFLSIQILGIQQDFETMFEDAFVQFGIGAVFLYEFLPQVLMVIGVSGLVVRVLDAGISVFTLVFIFSLGKLIGQFILYSVGKYSYRFFKGRTRELASADNVLRKYRYLIFFFPGWLGVGGDILMIFAGHQRVGFIKIAPILFAGNILRLATWLIVLDIQIGLPEIF